MKKQLIVRHFINNESGLIEFKKQLDKIFSAFESLERYNLNFGLKLTVDNKKISNELKERINEQTSRLPSDIWYLYDPIDRGPEQVLDK